MIGVADVAASIVAMRKFALGLYAAGVGCSTAIDGVSSVQCPVYSALSHRAAACHDRIDAGNFATSFWHVVGLGCSNVTDGGVQCPVYSAWSQPDCNRFRSWLCSATMCTYMYIYVDIDIDVYTMPARRPIVRDNASALKHMTSTALPIYLFSARLLHSGVGCTRRASLGSH